MERENVDLSALASSKLAASVVESFSTLIYRATELIRAAAPSKMHLDEFNFQTDELRLILSTPSPPQTNPLRIDAASINVTSEGSTTTLASALGEIKSRLDSTLLQTAMGIRLLPEGQISSEQELQAAASSFVDGMLIQMRTADKFFSIRPQIIQHLNTSLDQLQSLHKDGIRAVGIQLRRKNTSETTAIISQFEQFKGELIYRWNVKQSGPSSTIASVLSRMERDARNTFFNKASLQKTYEASKEKYDDLVQRYVKRSDDFGSAEQAAAALLNEVIEMVRRLPKAGDRQGILDTGAAMLCAGWRSFTNSSGGGQASSSSATSSTRRTIRSSSARSSTSSSSSSDPSEKWSLETYNRFIPELVAGIFALWTANSASFYQNATGSDREQYLLQPKPVQVISVFRMLGVGTVRTTSELLPKNMVEIKTGEGKSVTLAVTAVALALLGYDVSVSCYSEFLTQRDRRAFESLFDVLQVREYIHYGTFNELCEDQINCNGDLRTQVQQMLFPEARLISKIREAPKNTRQRILLIDEVDVFFRKDFFGNEYTPAAKITHESIRNLMSFIWRSSQLGQTPTPRSVQKSAEYGACVAAFQSMEELLREAVQEMIGCLKDYRTPQYIVQDNRVGYMQDQSVSYTTFYGYKTMWAYFDAASRDLISVESRDVNIGLLVHCGRFSFAEIPKSFRSIIGVTGTLSSLSEVEKDILKFYKIDRFTFAPSMYPEGPGAQTREWLPTNPEHLKIVFHEATDTEDTHLEALFQVILGELQYVKPSGSQPPGAALIFFESEEIQKRFSDYSPLRDEFDQIRVFSEKDDNQVKENWVREATMSGQLSLVPRSLGRGTDFSCEDIDVINRGGVMVIQTFLSEELSEEIQIRGRCGRQGQPGKYRLFLRSAVLEKVGVTEADIGVLRTTPASRYELLNNARNSYFQAEYRLVFDAVKQNQKPHGKAMRFLQQLAQADNKQAVDFLVRENTSSFSKLSTGHARTLVLVDGTGSMGRTLKAAKVCVSTMFDEVKKTLRDHGVDENFFQIQFAVYRNYSSRKERLLQPSGWESDSKRLSEFLKNVHNEGGQGNEAIEIALKHAVEQNSAELKQVLIIGDAKANSAEEVFEKRGPYQEYWNRELGAPTNWREQLDIFKACACDVPIHAYWVGDASAGTANFFRGLAAETGGKAEYLDTNSKQGSAVLTAVVGEAILNTHEDSAILVETYRKQLKLHV